MIFLYLEIAPGLPLTFVTPPVCDCFPIKSLVSAGISLTLLGNKEQSKRLQRILWVDSIRNECNAYFPPTHQNVYKCRFPCARCSHDTPKSATSNPTGDF